MTSSAPSYSSEASARSLLLKALLRPEWGLILAIATVVVLTALVDQRHNYWYNPGASAVNILRQTAMLGIFALGSAIVIISGGIDLSSGSVIAFSGSICATLMVLLAPEQMKTAQLVGLGTITLAIAGTLVVGLLIGSMHAWLITVVGLPPFIATLATLVGLRSLGRAIVENVTAATWGGRSTQIQIYDSQFRYLATSVWIPVVVFLVLTALAWLLMSRTVIGRHLHALGGNEQAAQLSGIRTDRLKWLAYCISAVLSSIAGIVYIGDQSVAAPQTLGQGYELNAIAAAVVGGCSLRGGIGTIPGTVLGVLFLRTVIDGVAKVIKIGADVYEGWIVGSVVVIAVALTQFRHAGRRGNRFLSGVLGIVTILNLSLLAGVLAALLAPTTAAGVGTLASSTASLTFVLLMLLRFMEGRNTERASAGKVLPEKSKRA
jgi:ribose/xylose/arabinose/galactoside ABC-type transport system permease subunit